MGLVLSVLLAGTRATAQGNLSWRTIRIHPSLTQQGTWYSNIHLNSRLPGAESEKRSDYVNTLTPAITFALNRPLLNLSIGLRAHIIRYQNQSGKDGTGYQLNLSGIRGVYGQRGRPGLYLQGSHSYAYVRDRYAHSPVEDPRYREGQPVERQTQDLRLEAGYGLRNRYSFHLAYKHNHLSYKDRTDQDSNVRQHTVETRLHYMLMPQTFAQLAYGLTNRAYFDYRAVETAAGVDMGMDSHIHRLTVGVYWDRTDKLDGGMRMGYSWHRYRQSQDRFGNPLFDFSTWIVDADLAWSMSQRTNVRVRALVEERDSMDRQFYSYNRSLIGVNAQHTMVHRLMLMGDGSYERNNYKNPSLPDRSREYGIYQLSCGVRYALVEWVSASARYTYRNQGVRGTAGSADAGYSTHRIMYTITGTL